MSTTQEQQVIAIFNELPGDTALYTALAKRLEVLKRHADPAYRGPERDGTITERQWGHIRNLANAARTFAFALQAMEANDDPDIPF